jgi:hypothetical protein
MAQALQHKTRKACAMMGRFAQEGSCAMRRTERLPARLDACIEEQRRIGAHVPRCAMSAAAVCPAVYPMELGPLKGPCTGFDQSSPGLINRVTWAGAYLL